MSFGFYGSYVVLWVLVVFQALLVLALLKQLTELKRFVQAGGLPASNQLPAGTKAPEFTALEVRSRQEMGSAGLDGRGGIVLFLAPDCTVCKGLATSLRTQAAALGVPLLAVCQGDERGCRAFVDRLGPDVPVLLDPNLGVSGRYHVDGSPTAVIIDADRRIRAYGHPQDAEALVDLVRRSLKTAA